MTGSERSANTRAISPTQLVFLLAASGLYVFLLEPVQWGLWTSLGILAAAAAVTYFTAIPLTLTGHSLWENKWAGLLIALMLMWTAERTLFSLGQFYKLAVYPRTALWIPVVCLGVACIYAASLGLEPLARLGLPVTLVCVGLLLLLTGTGWRLFTSPFHMDLAPLDKQGLLNATALLPELGLYVLFLPRVHHPREQKTGLRLALIWVLTGLVLGAWCVLLTVCTMGESTPRPYDLFTLSSLTGFSPKGRHDLWYLLGLTLSGFLRISLCLYGVCVFVGRFFQKLSLIWRAWIFGVLSLCGALMGARLLPSWISVSWTIFWVGAAVLWSVGVLFWERRRKA